MSFSNINQDYVPMSLPEDLTSPSPEADNVGLLLISSACNLYREKFKSDAIPFSFIEFYIEEISHYATRLSSTAKEFFDYYNEDKNLELYIRMYTFSGYNIAKGIKTIDGYQYLMLDPHDKFYIDNYIDNPHSNIDKTVAKELKEAYKLYSKGDELKSLNELYDDFLIEKFIENYNNVEHHIESSNNTPTENQAKVLDTTYIGAKNEMPNQKGKVVQLNIPRFKLPMSYPIDSNNSRILSEYKAQKICYADKCIKFINKHQITAIGFSLGFVQKRKAVKKKNNFNKFGFDF